MFCPHCGKENLADARFCYACGTPFQSDDTSENGSVHVPPASSEPTIFGTLAEIFGYLAFFIGSAPAIVMAIIGFCKYQNPENRAKCKKGLTFAIVFACVRVALLSTLYIFICLVRFTSYFAFLSSLWGM